MDFRSNGKGRMMEEQAKEELQMLEAQYPNHFDYLKLELKSFIFLLQSQQQDSQLLPENNHCSTFLSSFVNTDTQESTSLKEKKRNNNGYELRLGNRVVRKGKIGKVADHDSAESAVIKRYSGRKSKRRDRVDLVLERAQACLKKIRNLKTSLSLPS